MSNAIENNMHVKREQRFSVEDLKQLQVVIRRPGEEGEVKEYFADLVDISRRGLKFQVPICVGFAEELEIRVETIKEDEIYKGVATARHIRSVAENCWEVGCSIDPHLPEEVIDFVVGVSGKERRSNPRVTVSHPGELKREGQVEGASVKLINISMGGFCLTVKKQHEVGERVKLLVLDPNEAEHVISARVRWQNETDDGFLVGCSFVESNSHLVLLSCMHETHSEDGVNWYVIAAAIFAMFLPPIISLFVNSDGQAEQNAAVIEPVESLEKSPAGTSNQPNLNTNTPNNPQNVNPPVVDPPVVDPPVVDPPVVDPPAVEVNHQPDPIDPPENKDPQPVLIKNGDPPVNWPVSELPRNLVDNGEEPSEAMVDPLSVDQEMNHQPADVQRPSVDGPELNLSETEHPKPVRRKVDPPKVDPPKVDPPKVDPPKVDPPKVDPPKVDPPKVDPPKVDPPKVDPPKVDPPKVDPPKVDPPKVDPPKVDPPKVDPPKVDPPKVDPPKVDPPKVDPPKVGPPKVDPPKVDPPKVDPPKVDPPKVDPPKVDPPKVDPPKVEDPNLRVWNHHSGRQRIKAKLEKVDGDEVVLRDKNGKKHVLPYDWFSINDLIYLGEVGDK